MAQELLLEKPVEKTAEDSYDTFKEGIFSGIIIEGTSELFADAMSSTNFESAEINEFWSLIREMPREECLEVLSMPQELLSRKLIEYKKRIDSEASTVKEMLESFATMAKKNGFQIAYHCSPKEILPNRLDGEIIWDIIGTDADDRDGVSRAYYSLTYKNLYLKKHPKYLYAVRIKKGSSDYKLDPSTGWGRASRLSVIAKFDLSEIFDEMRYETDAELKKAA